MTWIGVEDKLPADLHKVLFVATNDTGRREQMVGYRRGIAWFEKSLFYSDNELNPYTVSVSHWKELDKLPPLRPHPDWKTEVVKNVGNGESLSKQLFGGVVSQGM